MMIDTNKDWIIIGRFGRPHGVKGLITINSYTEPRDNILKYPNWHGLIQKKWQPIAISHIEVYNQSIVAQVEGYSDRERVRTLTNVEIAVKREALPELEPGEYYWHELVGLDVKNKNGVLLGKIKEIMPTGSNDVLVVEGEKRHLIPYLPDSVVLQIDMENALITVDWDENF